MSRKSISSVHLTRASALLVASLILVACGKTGSTDDPRLKYQLTEEEAETWDRLYMAEAESAAVALWGLVGRGEFDKAMLMVERYGDERMTMNFRSRFERLWAPIVGWSAADFTKEPQIGLGEGKTVGFQTWGELLAGGFQRTVICDDSITAFFVFKGYWETETVPVYAAAGCGIFEVHKTRQWRPFAHLVFSADASEETVEARGQPLFSQNLDEFLAFLRSRTFGSFGS